MHNRAWQFVFWAIIALFAVAVVADVSSRQPVLNDEGVHTEVLKAPPEPPTAEGEAILAAMKAAGYPSADKLSKELKTRIVAAVESRELMTIDQDIVGTFTARLVGFTTSEQCADQDICLVVITNDKGTFVSYVIDQRHDQSVEETCSYGLGGFFGGDKYLIIKNCAQNIGGYETGYAVTIQSGVTNPIATMIPLVPHPVAIKDPNGNEVPEAVVFEYLNHKIILYVSEPGATRFDPPGAVMPYHYVSRTLTFVDEKGKETNLERVYDTVNDSSMNPIGDGDSVTIDYPRTATYGTPYDVNGEMDPTRTLMKFHDKGLYMWIYGGLYYYDPATGTIGLDLSQAP